jgi:hypothetical protein
MSTPYTGNPLFILEITVPDDGDEDVAAAYSTAVEQLADRTAYLKAAVEGGGPIIPEFTNAILHGNTTLPDGQLTGSISLLDFDIAGDVELVASGMTTLISGGDLAIKSSTFVILQDGLILLDAATSNVSIGNFSGAIQISAPDVTVNGTTWLHGALRLEAVNLANVAVTTVNGLNAFEYICPVATDHRTIILSGIAPLGWRVRFNAQKNTGIYYYNLQVGLRNWFLRNAATFTAAIEFVSDGTAWIPDDWGEGGNGYRNG